MAKIISDEINKEVEIEDGSAIKEYCDKEFNLPFGCEDGICGTCIIDVVDGMENLSEKSDNEKEFDLWELKDNQRLACQCRIKSGVVRIRYV